MSAPTVWLTTLGCAKNQVDSEKLTAMLDEAGYGRASDPARADVVMVNTCAFIEAAREESVEVILQLEEAKRSGASLVVLGCLAQRFGSEISEALPEADAVLGLDRYGELVGTLDRITNWQPVGIRRSSMDILHAVNRPTPTLPYAYVKVAEGCDKPCTFCAIPLIRGKQRSRDPANIRDEIRALTAGGVSEIVLVAQDLASYGRDIDAPGGLVGLLNRVSDVEGLRRLRLLYLYPNEIRPVLMAEMATNPLIAPYFDLSLQHAEERLLRAMSRPGHGGRYLELIGRIRSLDPEAALRSSFIVGFPGETDDDVETLAGFLEQARLDWAGFFPYSAEVGTPAAHFSDQIDPDAIAERLRYLQRTQDELTEEANAAQVGRVMEVLVDQVEDGVPVGRTYREAPEIDGMVTLDRGRPGEWVRARITASYGVDLTAEVVEA